MRESTLHNVSESNTVVEDTDTTRSMSDSDKNHNHTVRTGNNPMHHPHNSIRPMKHLPVSKNPSAVKKILPKRPHVRPSSIRPASALVRKGTPIIHVGSTMTSTKRPVSSSFVPPNANQSSASSSDHFPFVLQQNQDHSGIVHHGQKSPDRCSSNYNDVCRHHDPDGHDKELMDPLHVPLESDAVQEDTAISNNMDNNVPPLPNKEIVPYQHLGMIDPALNIAAPKPNESTMKDFCTKFKVPRVSRSNSNGIHRNVSLNPEGGNVGGNKGSSGSSHPHGPEKEMKDQRSGPLVEIVNGEIVIQESSIIVGGRRTTEEVDRELEGDVVVEENVAITATYTSFTNREKVRRWSAEETKKFYMALRQCGTDFSTMENFFDGTDGGNKRNRRELKCKYRRESRKHPSLIDMAMNPKVQLPYDLSVFGELDMDSVQDKVVPLGQARVTAEPADSLHSIATPALVTPAQSSPALDRENEQETVDHGKSHETAVVVTQESSRSVADEMFHVESSLQTDMNTDVVVKTGVDVETTHEMSHEEAVEDMSDRKSVV